MPSQIGTSLLLLSSIFGTYYGIRYARGFGLCEAKTFFKTVPVALLAVALAFAQADWIIVMAFGFCAVGDCLLERNEENGFIYGLGAFAVAHLSFTIFFATHSVMFYWGWGAIFLAYTIALLSFVLPNTGELKIPVLFYGLMIGLMAAWGFSYSQSWMLRAGILLFIFSDSLIGIHYFSPPKSRTLGRFIQPVIWWSYFAAQVLLALALGNFAEIFA